MAGFTGITKPNAQNEVKKMLTQISYRGKEGNKIFSTNNTTLGITYNKYLSPNINEMIEQKSVIDFKNLFSFSKAIENKNSIEFTRDNLGISPLYYGKTNDGALCFASEVKALLKITNDINEFKPGYKYSNGIFEKYYEVEGKNFINDSVENISNHLLQLLKKSIQSCIHSDIYGSWLSGGLDSSCIAALAKPYLKKLYTFSAGLKDSPDIGYAREVANFIKSEHHEIIITIDDIIKILPEVIYHLESFDYLLVRSSVMNFIVAKEASNYVDDVFSGEGGDELFAGYEHFKILNENQLKVALINSINSLHNTALQRVDRSSSTFGTTAHVCFLHPAVVDYVLQIPLQYKIHNGIEKWILRETVKDFLPEGIIKRKKSKFWEGAGVQELISDYANQKINDYDFNNEKILENGWELNNKEELFFYRIFKEYFGNCNNYDWMGRTR
ncbi:MAG: hypothetical protein STSR0008_11980 [Ignavibacterium sp.]